MLPSNLKIVKFKNGKYGVRKGWLLFDLLWLFTANEINPVWDTWFGNDEYRQHTEGTLQYATEAFKKFTLSKLKTKKDYGVPI